MAKIVKDERNVMDVDTELNKIKTSKKEKKVVEAKKTKKDNKKKKTKVKKHSAIYNFFHEVKVEFSKVKWPSKKDMIKYSIATISFIIFFALFFYLLNVIFALLKEAI